MKKTLHSSFCRPMRSGGAELRLQASFISPSTFFHSPPSFSPHCHRSSDLVGGALLCCPLALRIINTPAALPPLPLAPRGPARSAGSCLLAPVPTVTATRTICPSKPPLKEPVLRDKHTQPQSGLGSEVKEPRFLSRQTGAEPRLLSPPPRDGLW